MNGEVCNYSSQLKHKNKFKKLLKKILYIINHIYYSYISIQEKTLIRNGNVTYINPHKLLKTLMISSRKHEFNDFSKQVVPC